MSTGMKAALIGVPIVLVIAAVAATTGIIIGRNHAEKPTAAASTATPIATTVPIATPTPTPVPVPTDDSNGLDTFTAPKTLDGMPPSSDATAAAIKQSLSSTMGRRGTKATAQVYEAKGSDNPFILIGIPVAVPDAQTTIEDYFTDLSVSSDYDMGSPTTYDPGKFGALQCESGKLTADGLNRGLGMCIAADQGGIVITMYFGHKAASTATVTQMALVSFAT